MSGALFASPVELSPELIELHARIARDLRRAAVRAMLRDLVRSLQRWSPLPSHAGLAASVR